MIPLEIPELNRDLQIQQLSNGEDQTSFTIHGPAQNRFFIRISIYMCFTM